MTFTSRESWRSCGGCRSEWKTDRENGSRTNTSLSKVAKEHPDWLILDKNGKHARMTRDLATLCPAVPEVQAYYKQLTEKFIRDWGFDGSKLDNIYSVPACYNPAHHHKSPQDSVNAMGEVYKTIFRDDAGDQAGERDAGVPVRNAAITGVAAVYRSGGDGRSGRSGAGAAAHQNV